MTLSSFSQLPTFGGPSETINENTLPSSTPAIKCGLGGNRPVFISTGITKWYWDKSAEGDLARIKRKVARHALRRQQQTKLVIGALVYQNLTGQEVDLEALGEEPIKRKKPQPELSREELQKILNDLD